VEGTCRGVAGCAAPVYNRKRGYCRNCYARFLRHGSPELRQAPDGSGTLMNTGYRRVRVPGGRLLQHRLVAERVLGRPLPPDAVVHHVDGDRANNAPSNLVVCPSEKYHQLLHIRARALEACGHADWLKCQFCKEYSPPGEVYHREGRGGYHPACRRGRRAA
jgi:hypothetical protein